MLPPRYNWNIVESGIKHHQTNKKKCLDCVEAPCLDTFKLQLELQYFEPDW